MKKLLSIMAFLLFAVPANAATFIGLQTTEHKSCAKYNYGNCQFIYYLHNVPNVQPPQNPDFKIGFHVSRSDGMTYGKAKKIADQMAHKVEHPDKKLLDTVLADKKTDYWDQKRIDNAYASERGKQDQFIDPKNIVGTGQ